MPDDKSVQTRANLLNFWNKKDVYIGSTFKIKIYPADADLISGCTEPEDWIRYSDVAPGSDVEVVAFGADCVYHKPKNREKRTIEFHYLLKYADINSSGRESVVKYYTKYDDRGDFNESTKEYRDYFVSRPIKSYEPECLTVELRYCGDGIVDKRYGEECDPKTESFDASICDQQTCTYITNYNINFDFNDFNMTNFIEANITK
ncbi:hypothetical protein MNB_SV-6-587 [hydrothermal vent metagenome]|uniref:Uncharacterized protein n=1 Tax=hydrothermal vent metagenome TaxID=652676 RepID=A0A1W1CBZ6_9ZZZZ